MAGQSLRRRGGIFLLLLCAGCFLWSGRAQAAGVVEQVSVAVTADGTLPVPVQQRMEGTVAAIAAQLLTGRRLEAAEASAAREAAVIQEVFDKVLVGYSVARVTVRPGVETLVEVRLIPWDDVIGAVQVETMVEGMPPAIEAMVRHDLAAVEEVFAASLVGLPVAAADWTNGVLKRSLNDYLAQRLPEFRADFDVVPGPQALVSLTVYPRLPVVRTVDLSMRSDSVPNVALLNQRQKMQDEVNQLIGVPVGFVRRHEAEFAAAFAAALDGMPGLRALDLHSRVTLTQIEEKVAVMSRSDTDTYFIRAEGWADLARRGNDNHKIIFRLHAGYRPTPRDELFLQSDFAPQAVSCSWELGYAHRFSPWTKAILRYDMEGQRFTVGGEQRLSPRWLLRYEYRWYDQKGEGAIRYRLHDFLSLEYVADEEDQWLRVISVF